ncbi:MAG: YqgE/AlgH family protein [Chitinophaga sp.]|uniref:YqgE/AlgH family protein n=1 Tax=Chitinophaga sp. TaxID=1869181 RepID=UPI001B0BE06E|nr:YqgE/AlgH family protein [Chitinophaga sp.]MBO9730232.1 YqgE/AlgH family protein [Chitinophaga sp.]
MINAGIYIGSTSLLDDTVFEETVILITEYNEKGAMGFVVNKLFPRTFNELQEFSHSKPFPLYEGGPVDQEHLFFVHRRPGLITGGALIAGNIYLGGDFKAAVKHINNGILTEEDIRLFIGYCGWDFGELEAEIAEGSWQVLEEAKLF